MPRTESGRASNSRTPSLRGRLTARPIAPTQGSFAVSHIGRPVATPGLQRLRSDARRDTLLYVPKGYAADRSLPLIIMCHGAVGNARGGLAPMLPWADEAGILLLATASLHGSWDLIHDGYGPDVARLDQALTQTFAEFKVDKTRLAIGGFSDGASYALSLGLDNGDLFTHIIALSPRFMAPNAPVGRPNIYISHGRTDNVLPIDACSRSLVPLLKDSGYSVRYHEFDVGHTVPPEIAHEAAT
ncbi:MAG TPA: phospholipase [Ktedonobacterales bacterium]